uniref:Uncharacterized protein n=1 Tax=Arundo donax TaxID=35708 RepID=A0A0A9EB87_ARUDO
MHCLLRVIMQELLFSHLNVLDQRRWHAWSIWQALVITHLSAGFGLVGHF